MSTLEAVSPLEDILSQLTGAEKELALKILQAKDLSDTSTGSATIMNCTGRSFMEVAVYYDGPKKTHILKPADPQLGYSLLKVSGETITTISGVQDAKNPITHAIPARAVAEGLVSMWRISIGVYPFGIMVIAGDTPTAAELRQGREMEKHRCDALIAEADAVADSNNPERIRREITRDHIDALIWRGEDPAKRSWTKSRAPQQMQLGGCWACGAPMSASAFVCATCKVDLAEFAIARNKPVDSSLFPAIAAEIAFRKKQAEAAAPKQAAKKD